MNTSLMELESAMQAVSGQEMIETMDVNPNDLSAIQFGAEMASTSVLDPEMVAEPAIGGGD